VQDRVDHGVYGLLDSKKMILAPMRTAFQPGAVNGVQLYLCLGAEIVKLRIPLPLRRWAKAEIHRLTATKIGAKILSVENMSIGNINTCSPFCRGMPL
jgi:hypothetical protein